MEEFKNKIIELENSSSDLTYIASVGSTPVMLTAPHTMEQELNDHVKHGEFFTKAIVLYVAEHTLCSYLIKNKDTGIDSNHSDKDLFKAMLLNKINENNIKLVIDIHGAKKERDFDIELGTLNNLSSDYSTIKELIDAFNEKGIFKIEMNNPFKGGMITQKVYDKTDCDIIQIEINSNYRNIDDIEKLKLVCDSLISFIRQYVNIIGCDL